MAQLLSYALTTLADVKESMGVASSDTTWDNIIIRKINQATRQIEGYCDRRFLEQTNLVEYYNSTQTDQLILRQRPVTSTTTFTLEVRNTALDDDDFETVDTQLYFVDNSSGTVNLLFRTLGSWNRWRITYSAGYATIPEDLAEAAATLAVYYVENPGTNMLVQLKREGTRETRYFQGFNSFYNLLQSLSIDQIIDSYANLPINSDV